MLRVLLLLLLLAGIGRWQRGFATDTARIMPGWGVMASMGLNEDKKFFYFLYHLNLYPVASEVPLRVDSADEARRLMREYPGKLRQDMGTTFRSGDRGRTYLFFVDAWLNKRVINASVKPANELAFVVVLMALMTSFWAIRRTAAGVLLVGLLGSNPAQLYMTYKQENVFSWTITAMIMLLALNLPLVDRSKLRAYPWIAAVSSGLFLAFVRNFRSESTALLLSVVVVYLTMTWLTRRKRAALAVLCAVSLWAGTQASSRFIDMKLDRARAAVAAAGGPVYTGPVAYFHELWHPVWCGLGDFDKKHGYTWNDRAAYRAATPELQKENPELQLDPDHWTVQNKFYDQETKKYEIYYFEVPGYHRIIRDLVLRDIKSDPRWYGNILRKRVLRVFSDTTPVGLATSTDDYYVVGLAVGWLCIPLACLLVYARRWSHLKLLLFPVPLSFPSLIVYSGGGMPHYGCVHIVGAWLACLLLLEAAKRLRRTPGDFGVTRHGS